MKLSSSQFDQVCVYEFDVWKCVNVLIYAAVYDFDVGKGVNIYRTKKSLLYVHFNNHFIFRYIPNNVEVQKHFNVS